MSYQDVATRGGLPKATVANLAANDLSQVPRAETIIGLARGLGLPVSLVQRTIAEALGLAEPDEDSDPLTRRIRYALPDLTDDDRHDLAALVKSMLDRRRRTERSDRPRH